MSSGDRGSSNGYGDEYTFLQDRVEQHNAVREQCTREPELLLGFTRHRTTGRLWAWRGVPPSACKIILWRPTPTAGRPGQRS